MPFLNELASIHSGYSLRNPYAEFQRPNVGWITPSHIIAQNFNQLPGIEVKLVKNITVLKPGDVLLTNRVQFKAALFTAEDTRPTLASAAAWIIRPNPQLVDSSFLACWLNSAQGQKALHGLGNDFTTNKFIRKEDLGNLRIPLPSLQEQHQIGSLYACLTKQKNLLEQRFSLQQKLLNALVANI